MEVRRVVSKHAKDNATLSFIAHGERLEKQ